MSNTLALAAVTATLRHQLDGELTAAAARNEGVVGARTFSGPPGTPHAGVNAGAFVYLYRTMEHPSARNRDLAIRDENGGVTNRPVAAMMLRYLITCFGDEAALEPTRVMGVIATYLHAVPTITPAMVQAAQGSGQFPFLAFADLDEQIELVRITPVQLSDEDLNRIWSMLPADDFALSAAYDASVVLLERPDTPSVPLPVLQRGALVVPTRQPIIASVIAEGGTLGTAIRAGTPVEMHGEHLAATTSRIEIDGVTVPAVAITEATDELVRFTIPATTPAGPRVFRVIHDLGSLAPSVTVFEVASDPFVVLIRPEIASVSKAAGNVRIDVVTAIGATQVLEVVLNRSGGTEVAVRPGTLALPTRVTAPLAGLVPGTYLVRLRVDGVESVPDPPAFVFPTVVVP